MRVTYIAPYLDVIEEGVVTTWDWGRYRRRKMEYKKSISDAAVDGVIATSRDIDDDEATASVLAILEDLTVNGEVVVDRRPLGQRGAA